MCARVINLEKENQSLHQGQLFFISWDVGVTGRTGIYCPSIVALEKVMVNCFSNCSGHAESLQSIRELLVEDLRLAMSKLEARVSTLEKSLVSAQPAICPQAQHNEPSTTNVEAKKNEDDDDDDDDDIDLFGSSDEDEKAEKDRVREERLRQYAERKSKKPALIAKSSILLDVKPNGQVFPAEGRSLTLASEMRACFMQWDDETDMVKLEESVRTVQMDGLVWGASKLVPVGYGIKKLQIQCVVEDDKVGTDQLEEEITKFEDY
eukprot:g40856.t1